MEVGNFQDALSSSVGFSISPAVVFWIVVLSIWTLVWKGFGLWKAAKKKQLAWFIAILILNTAGILEILYIFVFSKMSEKLASVPLKSRTSRKAKPRRRR